MVRRLISSEMLERVGVWIFYILYLHVNMLCFPIIIQQGILLSYFRTGEIKSWRQSDLVQTVFSI